MQYCADFKHYCSYLYHSLVKNGHKILFEEYIRIIQERGEKFWKEF